VMAVAPQAFPAHRDRRPARGERVLGGGTDKSGQADIAPGAAQRLDRPVAG
jgi:hypothetical protein